MLQLRAVPYRLKPHRELIEQGAQRIAGEQLQRGVDVCVDAELDVHVRVHEVRKRCKKARALYRLMRASLDKKEYRAENTALRDIARLLSRPRDIYVMRRAYDKLLASCELELNRHELAPIARELTEDLNAMVEAELADALEVAAHQLRAAVERGASLSLDADGFGAVGGGLETSYARAHEALAESYAAPSPERFHEFRKRAKYHRYHMSLLRSLWPEAMRLREDQLHRLTDALGEDHDLAVMHSWLKKEKPGSKDARALLRGLILERRSACQKQAKLLAERLFCDPPKTYMKHMRALSRVSW